MRLIDTDKLKKRYTASKYLRRTNTEDYRQIYTYCGRAADSI
nr:MAG TPA: hypothetical protein [Caudoviricetes sp.]